MAEPAWVAQLVEHGPDEDGVGGASPPPRTSKTAPYWELFVYAWEDDACASSGAGSKGTGMFLLSLEQKQPSRGRQHLLELERSEQL